MIVNKDVVTGWLTIGLAVVLFTASFGVRDFAATGVGAGFLPRLAAILFAVLGAILLLQTRRRAPRASHADARANAPSEGGADARHFGGTPAVLLSACLMAAYVALLAPVGFIITTAAYVFLQILVLAKGIRRNYVLYGIVAVVTSVIAYYLFVRGFQVMLPAGILG